MITIRRQLLGLGFVAASSILAIHAAQAMSGPSAVQIDGGPFGSLQISGGVDGYGYYQSGTGSANFAGTNVIGDHTSNTGTNSNGANIGSALMEVQKTTGQLQFTIEVGSNGGTQSLGTSVSGQTSISLLQTGPLYLGYVTLAPTAAPGLTISAGVLTSLEGYESGVDWNNANQLTTALFYVENANARGVEAAYSTGPFTGTLEFGDGYDNGVFNYLQGLFSYTINATNTANVYFSANLGTTGPFTASYAGDSPIYANSNMIGAYYSYTMGNLNLVPEVQYQYTKARSILGVSKPTSNFGAALFADYSFGTSPYSIGAWGEYFDSHAGAATASANGANNSFTWFVGPNAEAVGVSVSPTWQYKDLFSRVDAGYLYLLNNKAYGSTYGYGNSGGGRGDFTGELEAGVLF